MEPNNASEIAAPIAIGRANGQQHVLTPRHPSMRTNTVDYDFFRFIGLAGTRYTVETFDVAVRERRAPGLWILDGDDSGEIDNDRFAQYGDEPGSARLKFTVHTSGIYLILVANPNYAEWSGRYSIRVCPATCLEQVFVPVARR